MAAKKSGNINQLTRLTLFRPEKICLTGGLARSRLFCQIIADSCGLPLEVASVYEGSSLGLAVCAAAGIWLEIYERIEEL
jgi:sugar (pentulose or hexulose) kinase